MLSSALVVLLSFFLPKGAEPYLSPSSIYAEHEKADVTVSIFDDALANQALAEYRETLAAPETARAGVVVQAISDSTIAERPAVTIDYTKPALVAKLDDKGDVVVIKGVETTRQTYLDLGTQHFVLTVWSKVDGVEIPALSDKLVAEIIAGTGQTATPPLFLTNGEPIEAFAEAMTDDFLSAPLRIDLTTQ